MSDRNQIIDELISKAVASGRPDRARWLRAQKTPVPQPGEVWELEHGGQMYAALVVHRDLVHPSFDSANTWSSELFLTDGRGVFHDGVLTRRLYPRAEEG